MKKIHKIQLGLVSQIPKKRVAAYARVSASTEATYRSLSTQVHYYSTYIQANPNWEYAGVFADNGIPGESYTNREEFKRMLQACEDGRIDMILTKSISRFARNTVDLLVTVRHLKELGIDVYFEKEHIHSTSKDGEFMLTILAAFAQEEARSISENQKWAIQKKFEEGKYHGSTRIFGYRWDGEKFVPEPDEAKIVKLIFRNYLKGYSAEQTERQLKKMGVKGLRGGPMNNCVIREILQNVTYTGNLLLQKTYKTELGTRNTHRNHGERPMYYVENTHEAIIDRATFDKVQKEMERRRVPGLYGSKGEPMYTFTQKIRCGCCGGFLSHGIRQPSGTEFWKCRAGQAKGEMHCGVPEIPDQQLRKIFTEILGLDDFDETVFREKILDATVLSNDVMEIRFKDGTSITKHWENTQRKDYWTYSRRVQKARDSRKNYGDDPGLAFTGRIICEECGGTFQRKDRRQKSDGSAPSYRFCRNRYRGCKDVDLIYEEDLMAIACQVLQLKEFSEKTFIEKVDHIVARKDRKLDFHMTDGQVITMDYPEKKPLYTPEMKLAKARNLRKFYGDAPGFAFTGRIICEKCGATFRRWHGHKKADGTVNVYRSCRNHYHGCKAADTIREDDLMAIACRVLNIKEFNEKVFTDKVDHIVARAGRKLEFYMMDGQVITMDYPKKKGDK